MRFKTSPSINKLATHIDKFRILLANNDVNILSINETQLDTNTCDDEVHIPGYEIIRRDRVTNGGGGVRFYVKN